MILWQLIDWNSLIEVLSPLPLSHVLVSSARGLLQKLLKRLSINALEFEMLLAGMDGGEADGIETRQCEVPQVHGG